MVDMSRALPLARHALPADKVPLWLRASGVRVEGVEHGEQLAWLRLIDGQWLARVRIFPAIGKDRSLALTLWVTQDAIIDESDPP
jgi:hypothetical protein